MKYALIGCGRISPNHIAAAIENGLEIAAICDVVPEKMDKLAERFGLNTKKYTDYKQALSENSFDLAAIATESGNHFQIAADCAEEKINLIIEKPVVLSLAEADAIIEKVKEKKIKACASLQNRFNKSIQKIRGAVEAGRFGKLFHGAAAVRWNRGAEYYAQAAWRGTWAKDGGALMNQCIHNVDLLCWLMGDAMEVSAYADNKNHPYIEAEDIGVAIIKFQSGAFGVVEGTVNVFPENLEETLHIFGEKGTVKAGGKSVNVIEEWRFADDGREEAAEIKTRFSENPPDVYGFGHAPLYADMISAVKNNREPYVTLQEGRKALELILAIYKSAAEGGAVKLPLKAAAAADFAGSFQSRRK
jgi:predicted dehydrogenase